MGYFPMQFCSLQGRMLSGTVSRHDSGGCCAGLSAAAETKQDTVLCTTAVSQEICSAAQYPTTTQAAATPARGYCSMHDCNLLCLFIAVLGSIDCDGHLAPPTKHVQQQNQCWCVLSESIAPSFLKTKKKTTTLSVLTKKLENRRPVAFRLGDELVDALTELSEQGLILLQRLFGLLRHLCRLVGLPLL